jgi:hypothetical protein
VHVSSAGCMRAQQLHSPLSSTTEHASAAWRRFTGQPGLSLVTQVLMQGCHSGAESHLVGWPSLQIIQFATSLQSVGVNVLGIVARRATRVLVPECKLQAADEGATAKLGKICSFRCAPMLHSAGSHLACLARQPRCQAHGTQLHGVRRQPSIKPSINPSCSAQQQAKPSIKPIADAARTHLDILTTSRRRPQC